MKRSIAFLFSLAAVACLCNENAAIAADAPSRAGLNIGAQPLSRALLDFSEQTGLQIGYAADLASGKITEGVEGIDDPGAALAEILASTGLEYEFVNHETVVIRTASSASQAGPEDLGNSPPVRELMLMASLQQPAEQNQSDEEEQEADEDDAVVEEPVELKQQVVTGSRLEGGDPTAWVHSFTAEDIASRGVSSIEELFRTLLWSFPSITTQTNMNVGGNADDTDISLGEFGLGISTINLRSMGSDNTLVLVNGRRVAGAAGYEENFANTLNIPLGAIERVDVQLDGASAVYGSDAIGGVVNIILKSNYKGASATVRNEFSSSGADRRKISLLGGYYWAGGNITATASREASRPIDNKKTGWTSMDYRNRFGPEYDLRTKRYGQPGVVCVFDARFLFQYLYPRCSFNSTRYQLPASHSGLGATVDDFTTDLAPTDSVLPFNGEDSTNTSFSLNAYQDITDSFRVYADVLYSSHDSLRERRTVLEYLVPAGNAYNPFGKPVIVAYWPAAEIEAGLMPRSYMDAGRRQRNYTVGFVWDVRGHELDFNVTRSKSQAFVWLNESNRVRGESDPGQEAFFAALESPEPSQAINLFGNGSEQGDVFADLFSFVTGRRGNTVTTSYQPVLRGDLFRVWGGEVEYVLGAEVREDVFNSQEEVYGPSGVEIKKSSDDTRGVDRPAQDYIAYFAELSVPFVGEDNARPGLRSLVLSLQARRDTYRFTGSVGRDAALMSVVGRVYVPGEGWMDLPGRARELVGPSNLEEAKRGSTSPRVGLQVQTYGDFTLRASWSRSFRPPLLGELFGTTKPAQYPTYILDLHHPSGEPSRTLVLANSSPFSPHLLSEFSDNYSVGFEWSPPGLPALRWSADWSLVDFTNRIESTIGLLFGSEAERRLAQQHPGIVQRDAEGYITEVNWSLVNLAEKVSEILETEFQYVFETRLGRFASKLRYLRVLDESYQITKESPRIVRKGTALGSSEYRVTGSLKWTVGRFGLNTFVHYTPAYENTVIGGGCVEVVGRCTRVGGSLPALMVKSLTTVDLSVAYQFDSGLRLSGGGRNLFKAEAPTIWSGIPYNPTRWDARGRVFFLEVNWET